jgi:hypothetical protein
MELQTAEARYEKTWHEFLSELERRPTLRLTPFLRSKHVYHRGFQKWMYRNGHSVGDAKGRVLALKMERADVPSSESESLSFLPVNVSGGEAADTRNSDFLTGISLTLPDGTVVSIRRGSAEAVVSFLKLYSGEGVPCSD